MTYTEMKKLSTDELEYDIEEMTEDLQNCSTQSQAVELKLYIANAKHIIETRK